MYFVNINQCNRVTDTSFNRALKYVAKFSWIYNNNHEHVSFQMYWSHHQKIVVIDQKIAFIGGIDLCFGRYDTQKHPLVDDNQLQRTFPG